MKTRLLGATAFITVGMVGAHPALAQSAPAAAGDAQVANGAQGEVNVGDIVVTGTRVVRNGYQAPVPVSVIGTEDINAKAPVSLADYVNEIPALAGSVTPQNNTPGISGGISGVNALNLRNLGVNRTLVLLDGQRVGASTLGGHVDIDQFPQALVKRVDVVTGGASADWGSDAVAGVVNFILDRGFKGVKGDAQGGVTTYGDNRSYKLSLAAGAGFADDRGHVLVSGEIAHEDGIEGLGGRKWYDYSKIFVNPGYTPTNGQPQLLVRPGAGFATATPGGIITSGPLRGIYFDEGGTPKQFNYGSIIGGNVMQGGQYQYADWAKTGDLYPQLDRKNVFGYASFDVTDGLQLFGQLSWGESKSHNAFGTLPKYAGITVQADNAFIPPSVAAQAAAQGVTSFTLGSFLYDVGPITVNTTRSSLRSVLGARGEFEGLGSKWSWDAYWQKSVARSYMESNLLINSNFNNAVDSVRAANGSIVCRVTLANPSSGCVPFNVFGTGVNSQAALDYVRGTPWLRLKLTEDVLAANLRGNPFSTWAGPVSVAFGVERRTEGVSGSVDALDAASALTSPRVPPYQAGNYLPSFGSYRVTEGYLQTVVPLAKDLPFAKELDLLAGIRATDYSTSGYVTTWKVGLTYKPIEDLTVRVTRSRDIRAPNLAELFQAQQATTVTYKDPANALSNVTAFQVTSGNINLRPERADSFGAGLVLQPTFLPGFAASVDYWDVKIRDAITTLIGQAVLDQCSTGNTALCSQVTRNGAGTITSVAVQPINLSKQHVRGIDFEVSYRAPLLGGNLRVRGLATHYIKHLSENGINAPVSLVGKNQGNNADASALPHWSYNATVGWDKDPVGIQLTARGFSSGVYNPQYIQCTSACPASTPDRQTIENNFLPGALYFDLNLTFKVRTGVETFLTVDNIANKDPASAPWLAGGAPVSIDKVLFDTLGRTFRAGVRFKM